MIQLPLPLSQCSIYQDCHESIQYTLSLYMYLQNKVQLFVANRMFIHVLLFYKYNQIRRTSAAIFNCMCLFVFLNVTYRCRNSLFRY